MVVFTHQIMTCLLVIPKLIVLPYPNLRITLSKITYYSTLTYALPKLTCHCLQKYQPILTAINAQNRPLALNRAMRTKRESLDPAELEDNTHKKKLAHRISKTSSWRFLFFINCFCKVKLTLSGRYILEQCHTSQHIRFSQVYSVSILGHLCVFSVNCFSRTYVPLQYGHLRP